jgi:sugar/nucleoside kinase (ribokinase family)
VSAPRVQVVDTTGAGDVFAAGLVHALALGKPMPDALQTAVAWGSATVTCLGVPGPEAIRELA